MTNQIETGQRAAFASVTTLFFAWGFITVTVDPLIATLKAIYELSFAASKAATSGVLCMAIVGGAVLPLLMGHLADRFGLHMAYAVPLAAYACIAAFGLAASRIRLNMIADPRRY